MKVTAPPPPDEIVQESQRAAAIGARRLSDRLYHIRTSTEHDAETIILASRLLLDTEPKTALVFDYARDAYRGEVEGLCDDYSPLIPNEYETEADISKYVDRLYEVGEALGLPFEQAVAEERGNHQIDRLIEAVRRYRPDSFDHACPAGGAGCR